MAELREIILEVENNRDAMCNGVISHQQFEEKRNQFISEIKSLIKEKLPQKTCPIIRALDKRLKCKFCSHSDCKSRIKNDILTEIEKIVENL